MKQLPLDVSFVVPIYNNASTLVSQVAECEKILEKRCGSYEMILCDDGSFDGTGSLLRRHYANRKNVTILTHKKNQGIARTLRQLYRSAKLDYIFLFSVDGDWEPKDIDRMVDSLNEKRADIVLGVRSQTNYSLYRRVVSFFYNFLPFLLFGVKTYDAGSIKIFKKSLYDHILLISRGVFLKQNSLYERQNLGIQLPPVTTSTTTNAYRTPGKAVNSQASCSLFKICYTYG